MMNQFMENDEYKNMLDLFEQMIKYSKPNPHILLGDSIFQGFRINEFLPGYYFLNRGINGDTTEGVLKRLKHSVNDLKPDKVFILIGTNDIPKYSDEQILRNFKDIYINIISHCSAEILTISILPTNSFPDRPNDRIINLNEKINETSKQFETKFVDIHPMFCNEDHELRIELTTDGLHLNSAGYNILAKTIKGHLD